MSYFDSTKLVKKFLENCYKYGLCYAAKRYKLYGLSSVEEKFNAHDVSAYAVLLMREAIHRRPYESYNHARANFTLYLKCSFATHVRSFKSKREISFDTKFKNDNTITIEEVIIFSIESKHYKSEEQNEQAIRVKSIFDLIPQSERAILTDVWIAGNSIEETAKAHKRSTKYIERLCKEQKNKIARKLIFNS